MSSSMLIKYKYQLPYVALQETEKLSGCYPGSWFIDGSLFSVLWN